MKIYSYLFCKVLLSLLCTHSVAAMQDCNMIKKYDHFGTEILSANIGISSLYYKTEMDVNTDGASRSYHPDDPRGKTLAYNNMGNAITKAWDRSGRRITCDRGNAANRKGACFTKYMNAFEGTRDLNYKPSSFPKVETTHIIPWQYDDNLKWEVPCTSDDGFFISQTSLILNKNLHVCDQNRYIDSLKINAVVYPGNIKWYSKGVFTDKGDLVITRNRNTGVVAYAIHGDSGPENIVGEGSIALTAFLSGKTISKNSTYDQIKKLVVKNVDYLVFPTHDVERHFRNLGGITQEKINIYGKEVFEEWGGISRLDSCSKA